MDYFLDFANERTLDTALLYTPQRRAGNDDRRRRPRRFPRAAFFFVARTRGVRDVRSQALTVIGGLDALAFEKGDQVFESAVRLRPSSFPISRSRVQELPWVASFLRSTARAPHLAAPTRMHRTRICTY